MKRFVCFLFISIMVLLFASSAFAFTWTTYSPEEYTLVGDLNIDNKIDAKDALEVLKFSVDTYVRFPIDNSAEELLKSERDKYYKQLFTIVGDLNKDEKVNAQDALHILQYVVGKRDAFEKSDLSELKDLVYPQLVPTTPTDVTSTDT